MTNNDIRKEWYSIAPKYRTKKRLYEITNKKALTDIYGEFAIWLWGRKIPIEIFKCQRFIRKSPLGKYIKRLEITIEQLSKQKE